MKKFLLTATVLMATAIGMNAQHLEVRARHYRYVVDDARPGVHKTYDPRRDCMFWRDGRGRFLGEVRNTITLREKRMLDRRRGYRPGPPPPPRHAAGPTPGERRAMRREAERREIRREMRRDAARREMRREAERREIRSEMRRDAAVRDMRRDAARREMRREEMRRDMRRRGY
jgi:hypothetical protein